MRRIVIPTDRFGFEYHKEDPIQRWCAVPTNSLHVHFCGLLTPPIGGMPLPVFLQEITALAAASASRCLSWERRLAGFPAGASQRRMTSEPREERIGPNGLLDALRRSKQGWFVDNSSDSVMEGWVSGDSACFFVCMARGLYARWSVPVKKENS
jgi:hypothetical protein